MQKKNILIVMFFLSGYFLLASGKIIHLSIDDVTICFQDLTKNEKNYTSIFQNKLFKYLKKIHDKYNAKISLYCIFQSNNFTLDMVPSKWQSEFIENSDWLKFGYHCYNVNTMKYDYSRFVNEIIRITGTSNTITKIVRLEKFQGELGLILDLKNSKHGIKALLTSDDNRNSYYLNEDQNNILRIDEKYYDEINNLWFYVTDFRFDNAEKVSYLYDLNRYENEIFCFTHEWILSIEFKKNIVKYCLALINSKKVKNIINYVLQQYVNDEYQFIN